MQKHQCSVGEYRDKKQKTASLGTETKRGHRETNCQKLDNVESWPGILTAFPLFEPFVLTSGCESPGHRKLP